MKFKKFNTFILLIIFTLFLLITSNQSSYSQDYSTHEELITKYSLKLLQSISEANQLKKDLATNPTPENLAKYNKLAANIIKMKTELPKISKAVIDAKIANSTWEQCKIAVNDTYIEPLSSIFIASPEEMYGPNWKQINDMYKTIHKKQQELLKKRDKLLKNNGTKEQFNQLTKDIEELKKIYKTLKKAIMAEKSNMPLSTYLWTEDAFGRYVKNICERFDTAGIISNAIFLNIKFIYDIAKPAILSEISEYYVPPNGNLTYRIADEIVLDILTAGGDSFSTVNENIADKGTEEVVKECLGRTLPAIQEAVEENVLEQIGKNLDEQMWIEIQDVLKQLPYEQFPKTEQELITFSEKYFSNKAVRDKLIGTIKTKYAKLTNDVLQAEIKKQSSSRLTKLTQAGKKLTTASKWGSSVDNAFILADFLQEFITYWANSELLRESLNKADLFTSNIRDRYKKAVKNGDIDSDIITEEECVNMIYFNEGSCFPEKNKPDDKSTETPDDKTTQKPDDNSTLNPDNKTTKKPDDNSTLNPDTKTTKKPDDISTQKPDDKATPPDDSVISKPPLITKGATEEEIIKLLLQEKEKLLKEAKEVNKKLGEIGNNIDKTDKDLLTQWDIFNTEGYSGLSPQQFKLSDEEVKKSLPKVHEARTKAKEYRECLKKFRTDVGEKAPEYRKACSTVAEMITKLSKPDPQFKTSFINVTGPFSIEKYLKQKRTELDEIQEKIDSFIVTPNCTLDKSPTIETNKEKTTPTQTQQNTIEKSEEILSATISGLKSQEIFGTSKQIFISVNTTKYADKATIIWNSSPNLIFNPERSGGTNASTTVTFDRMSNPTRIWAEITIPGKKTIESNQLEIEVVSPKYELIFDPPKSEGKLKQPVKVSIKATPPPVQDKLVDYRWVEPADRKELSNGVIEIIPVDTIPINIAAIARVPGVGDTVNDQIKGQFTASSLNVTVKVLKAKYDTPISIWDPKKGIVQQTKQFAVHQDILVQASVEGIEKDKVLYKWSVNEDSHIVAGIRSDIVTVNRSQTGTCIASVIISDKEGNKLGSGEISFQVPISQEDMLKAGEKDKAKLAKEKLIEAKKEYNNSNIDKSIEILKEATSLDSNNKEVDYFLNRILSEKEQYKTIANTAKDLIMKDQLDSARAQMSQIPSNFLQYTPIKEIFDMISQRERDINTLRSKLIQDTSIAMELSSQCKYNEAIKMMEDIISKDPLKDTQQALKDPKHWLSQFKNNKVTIEDLIQKTKNSIAVKDYKNAYQTAFTAYSINRNCPGVPELLSIAEQNKKAEASKVAVVEESEKIKMVNKQEAIKYYEKAKLEISNGNYSKSIEYIKKALELDPDNITYLNILGLGTLLIGDKETSIKTFKKIIKLDPSQKAEASKSLDTLYSPDYEEIRILTTQEIAKRKAINNGSQSSNVVPIVPNSSAVNSNVVPIAPVPSSVNSNVVPIIPVPPIAATNVIPIVPNIPVSQPNKPHVYSPPAETKISDNGNLSGCSFTNSARFNINQASFISKIDIWYNWKQGQTTLPYTLRFPDGKIRNGTLHRSDCDPYQKSWCKAIDNLNIDLYVGNYTAIVPDGGICQNSETNGNGVIRIYAGPIKQNMTAVASTTISPVKQNTNTTKKAPNLITNQVQPKSYSTNTSTGKSYKGYYTGTCRFYDAQGLCNIALNIVNNQVIGAISASIKNDLVTASLTGNVSAASTQNGLAINVTISNGKIKDLIKNHVVTFTGSLTGTIYPTLNKGNGTFKTILSGMSGGPQGEWRVTKDASIGQAMNFSN